jgi:hypothetical protein
MPGGGERGSRAVTGGEPAYRALTAADPDAYGADVTPGCGMSG